MPVRVGKMSPTEPLPTMFAILLAALIARLIHMRNCLAALFLGFHCCRVHCILPVAGGGASGKWRSADGFHHAHFVHTAAGNIHLSVGRCRHIAHDSTPRRDGRARKASRFRIERSWEERSHLAGQPQRIADRLEHCPLMVSSKDAIPIEKGIRFHYNAPLATFDNANSMGHMLMSCNSVKCREKQRISRSNGFSLPWKFLWHLPPSW